MTPLTFPNNSSDSDLPCDPVILTYRLFSKVNRANIFTAAVRLSVPEFVFRRHINMNPHPHKDLGVVLLSLSL